MAASNKIQLLPDSVANQIAAGEVIQRPASVVKELIENAVDAGSTEIEVFIEDAGRTLISVKDNGSGMDEEDALLCFKRHATSKLASAEDLFSLATKGFRGEALASIAAIAHVKLITRKESEELGIAISNNGGKIEDSEEQVADQGTTFHVKNLFYNVPARRKFLKSNAVEQKHIIEEFVRIALIHPEIAFSLFVDQSPVYQLEKTTAKQRIVGLFGKNYLERLVPIEEKTDFIEIEGFIVKPEFSKKSRGEQYFFANGRFIKHAYLHHAINQCFSGLISENSYPSYFIQLKCDPQEIDVNIHPTKTEIKFSEERSIYAVLKATVQRSLNRYSVAPSLDFDQETSFDTSGITWDQVPKTPEIKVDKSFNPFKDSAKESSSSFRDSSNRQTSNRNDIAELNKLYQSIGEADSADSSDSNKEENSDSTPNHLTDGIVEEPGTLYDSNGSEKERIYFQVQSKIIVTEMDGSIVFVNQNRAHQRVLFEHFVSNYGNQKIPSQRLLFPQKVNLAAKDAIVFKDLLEHINSIGFEIDDFGDNCFVVNASPMNLEELDFQSLIEQTIEEYNAGGNGDLNPVEKLAKSMAKKIAIKSGQDLSQEEMSELCIQLFNCDKPLVSPGGKPTLVKQSFQSIENQIF